MKKLLLIGLLFAATVMNAQWTEISNSLNVNYVIQNAGLLNSSYPIYQSNYCPNYNNINERNCYHDYIYDKKPVVNINVKLGQSAPPIIINNNYPATEYYINEYNGKEK